jgi:DNA repair photolyase
MIISASYRTDIPAFYGPWFLGRLQAGFVQVANPYGGPPSRLPLAPAKVEGIVFWTKNAGPFLDGFETVRAAALPFVVQYSITGLPRGIERSVPGSDVAIAHLRRLGDRFGRRAVVWRFDPIMISEETPTEERRTVFARLAAALAGAVDEVVVSFLQPYAKVRRTLADLAWRDPPVDEKRALLADLAAIAADHGMRLTLCTQPGLVDEGAGLTAARCIDAERLGDVAGRAIPARTKGNRPGCLCAESRDIGAYDTCAMGCGYCYAVRDRSTAQTALATHDPQADRL